MLSKVALRRRWAGAAAAAVSGGRGRGRTLGAGCWGFASFWMLEQIGCVK